MALDLVAVEPPPGPPEPATCVEPPGVVATRPPGRVSARPECDSDRFDADPEAPRAVAPRAPAPPAGTDSPERLDFANEALEPVLEAGRAVSAGRVAW